MINRTTAAALLPPYAGKKDVHAGLGVGTNSQLVRNILADFPKAVEQTRKLAPKFQGKDLESTASNVWNFLKTQIRYKEDSGLFQTMRLPSALIRTGQGDCKSFSLFAAGIMANLGYPVALRFTGYGGATYPGHVYILAGPASNRVIIDAVWHKFNQEKQPWTYKKDYTMEISTISGIGCTGCGVGCANCDNSIGAINLRKAAQGAKKAFQKAGAGAKAVVNNIKAGGLKQAVKTIIGAGPRTAFLQLVKGNIHNFAGRLDKNRNAALNKWKQLGGLPGELNASINTGKKRKPILGVEGIGVAGETIAAILVAAAPVIVAMASLLGKGKTTEPPTDPVPPDMPAPDGEKQSGYQAATEILKEATNVLNNVTQRSNAPANGGASYGGTDYTPGGGNASEGPAPQDSSTQSGAPKWLLPVGLLALALVLK